MSPSPPARNIVGVTCIRDDGSYLLEWVAHHLPLGIDHFLIFSHDCTDATPALLDALEGTGVLTHVPFRHDGKASAQWQALKLAGGHERLRDADRVLVFDCDEFLWLAPGAGTLPDLVAGMEEESGPCDALALPWRLFGSGGARRRAEGITPERFLHAAPPDLHFPIAHLFKTLARPDRFARLGVHRPRARRSDPPPRWLGPDGQALDDRFARQDSRLTLYGTPRGTERVGLNHYCLRSVEEFLVKAMRGLPNHMDRPVGLDYWVERNWNTLREERILPMLEATRAAMDDLLADPAVRAAHERCMMDWRARAKAAAWDMEKLRLAWKISLLGENRPPEPAQAMAYVMRQNEIRKMQA